MIYTPEIRFADIDSYGIVHNAKYLIFFEQSRISLFHKIAGNWDWQKRGVLVASQKVEYRHPVKLNDTLEISVWVKSIGAKSLTIAYEAFIVSEESRVLSAESETVIVCFDPSSNSTMLVPEEWENAIKNNDLLSRPSAC
jgi:YbgC/YbaW family acyl-CoA thioester hydrolase